MDKILIAKAATNIALFASEYNLEPYDIDIWNGDVRFQAHPSSEKIKNLKDGRLDIEVEEIDKFGFINFKFKYNETNFKVVLA